MLSSDNGQEASSFFMHPAAEKKEDNTPKMMLPDHKTANLRLTVDPTDGLGKETVPSVGKHERSKRFFSGEPKKETSGISNEVPTLSYEKGCQ